MHNFESFKTLMGTLDISGWGVADLSACSGRHEPYRCGIVMMKRYPWQGGSDRDFHEMLMNTKEHLEEEASSVCDWLEERQIPFRFVSSLYDSVSLRSSVSHKELAVMAGLGWIGRSSLFVSPEYGPRVRLTSILADVGWAVKAPAVENRCGACRDCVEACAHSALRGAAWNPTIDRDALIDAFVCNDRRASRAEELGYKEACGRCLLACPWGTSEILG